MENQGRKYLPTISELLDRLTICSLKEVKIPEHKKEYQKEIQDIIHDINIILKETNFVADGNFLRLVIILSQMNQHIWENEAKARSNGNNDGSSLVLSHSVNGLRCTAKNKIQENFGGRKDFKIDCLGSEFKNWEIMW